MFTQPGQGAGVVVALAAIVLFNPTVEFPRIPDPVKDGGGAVKVPVPVGETGAEPVVLDDFDVDADDFEPLADVDVGDVVNVPVMCVSWKFCEKATSFDPTELKRIKYRLLFGPTFASTVNSALDFWETSILEART